MTAKSDETGKTNSLPASRRKRTRKLIYYKVDRNIMSSRPGCKIINYNTLQKGKIGISPAIPWPEGLHNPAKTPFRFPDEMAVPIFLFDPKLGRAPRDIENFDGYWVISAAFKAVLDDVAPGACDYRRCEVVLPDGSPGRETWLCTISTIFVDAVDLEKSEKMRFAPWDDKIISPGSDTIIHFKPEVVGNSHLFKLVETSSSVYCDHIFKEACKQAGLKNLGFRQVSK